MPHSLVSHRPSPDQMRLSRRVGQIGSFALAALSGFAVGVNTIDVESFNAARLGAVIVVLFSLHLLRYRRFLFTREFGLYALLVCYMAIQLLWTADVRLAMNTLVPAAAFVLILMQFGALVTHHDVHAVLLGTLGGFLMSAALYTSISGFPFVYPANFSYNAIAGMYLIALFVALLLTFHGRSKVPFLVIGAVLLLLIVATTSIKTNIGILLGAAAAGLMYLRLSGKVLRRNAVPLAVLAVLAAFAVTSNDELVERLQTGAGRVALGIEVLKSRDDVAGYSALASRDRWLRDGLTGWAQNPLFGHGVEAFRDRFGMTSHSTPVDLLYNSGLIGFGLFYGMFISIAWRLFHSRDAMASGMSAAAFGALVCYLFITLSGTMHYNSALAVFIAISAARLRERSSRNSRFRRPSVATKE